MLDFAKKYIMNLIRENKWQDLAVGAPPSEVSNILGFKEGMKVAYSLLYNDAWDESLQKYAAELLEALKKEYNEDWIASWKNEAFLGIAYDIVLNYEKKYTALKNAFNQVSSPPPELYIRLADCYISPGIPPISVEEALKYLIKSTKSVIYQDAAQTLALLYHQMKDAENESHWKEYVETNKDSLEQSPDIVPDCLQT